MSTYVDLACDENHRRRTTNVDVTLDVIRVDVHFGQPPIVASYVASYVDVTVDSPVDVSSTAPFC